MLFGEGLRIDDFVQVFEPETIGLPLGTDIPANLFVSENFLQILRRDGRLLML